MRAPFERAQLAGHAALRDRATSFSGRGRRRLGCQSLRGGAGGEEMSRILLPFQITLLGESDRALFQGFLIFLQGLGSSFVLTSLISCMAPWRSRVSSSSLRLVRVDFWPSFFFVLVCLGGEQGTA
jgi:hypothetical protein